VIRQETSFDSMGTTYSIVLYGDCRDRMEEAANAAFNEVQRLNNLL
jgi:hypothetical protein